MFLSACSRRYICTCVSVRACDWCVCVCVCVQGCREKNNTHHHVQQLHLHLWKFCTCVFICSHYGAWLAEKLLVQFFSVFVSNSVNCKTRERLLIADCYNCLECKWLKKKKNLLQFTDLQNLSKKLSRCNGSPQFSVLLGWCQPETGWKLKWHDGQKLSRNQLEVSWKAEHLKKK